MLVLIEEFETDSICDFFLSFSLLVTFPLAIFSMLKALFKSALISHFFLTFGGISEPAESVFCHLMAAFDRL